MQPAIQHVGIFGAGAWGTALALTLRRAGRAVTLCAHSPTTAEQIRATGMNAKYLPDILLDAAIRITADPAELDSCDAWLIATPAQHTHALCHALTPFSPRPVILAAKGIERESGTLLTERLADWLPRCPVAILSGPSFAAEIARGLPAALTLAARDASLRESLIRAMATPQFRLYGTDDVIGAAIGGAIKNVLAIACGITVGRALGDNARAAIITRGLAELVRLGVATGGRAETLMGLSGLGDLVLTCSSLQSRNMSLGVALGQGQPLAAILAQRVTVAEGVTTAAAALTLARRYHVDMPIVAAVDAVLQGKADIDAMIAELLARPLKAENVNS